MVRTEASKRTRHLPHWPQFRRPARARRALFVVEKLAGAFGVKLSALMSESERDDEAKAG